MPFHIFHPFNRYAPFTDLKALQDFCACPLRRSLRVHTLKTTVEQFKKWAREKRWELTQVPWCPEGFFVDDGSDPSTSSGRSGDGPDREAFGRDLLHQLGHTYIQEAASMLPVELLDPQPGETILDLCAAPGSKTTQIASAMAPFDSAQGRASGASGVIVANDVQEKRLWVLKRSLHRSGVLSAIVTKKVGQWFGCHMTERFDRVLCDAPCTAQGTVRKDPGALAYSSNARVRKMAAVQTQLLEAALHSAKIGGRIVYSTCTLTPEENEMVVAALLEKFQGKVEVVDPRTVDVGQRAWDMGKAIRDSQRVQVSLPSPSPNPGPMLRLWPQTYDTSGFFCAVLRKVASTRLPTLTPSVPFQEKPLKEGEQREVAKKLEERYGTSFLLEGDNLFVRGETLLLGTEDSVSFPLPVRNYSLGLPFGKVFKDGTLRISHELATLRGHLASKNTCELNDRQRADILAGKDTHCASHLQGDVVLQTRGLTFGMSLALNQNHSTTKGAGHDKFGSGQAKEGNLKNTIPRWFISQTQ